MTKHSWRRRPRELHRTVGPIGPAHGSRPGTKADRRALITGKAVLPLTGNLECRPGRPPEISPPRREPLHRSRLVAETLRLVASTRWRSITIFYILIICPIL